LLASFCALQAWPAAAAPTATEIVERAEALLWGKTAVGDFDMTIATPARVRTLSLNMWMDRLANPFCASWRPPKMPVSLPCVLNRKCGTTCRSSSAPSLNMKMHAAAIPGVTNVIYSRPSLLVMAMPGVLLPITPGIRLECQYVHFG